MTACLCNVAGIIAWMVASFPFLDSLDINCFRLQSGISGKTCISYVVFTAINVASKIQCAELCRDGCAGVFYSSSTKQCHGCAALYDSDVGLGTLQDSVYYTKKWHYEYVGCFRDCQNVSPCPRRVMQHWTWSNSMTLEMCAEHCKPRALRYFGMQNHIACYCDDETYDVDGPANNCDDYCYGNPSQTCGGFSANSVYQIVLDC